MKNNKVYTPEQFHRSLLKKMPQKLAFNEKTDFSEWRNDVKIKYLELLGDMPENTNPDLQIEYEIDNDNYIEKKFTFQSEEYVSVPCILVTPKLKAKPFPMIICIQGHTSGMHISLGRKKYIGDEKFINTGDWDFGIQAIRQGYAALMIEMRCFGDRKSSRSGSIVKFEHPCRHAAMVSLLLGRTMLGERVWDVSKSIDVVGSFDEIDIKKIGILGNSGGGMVSYAAACYDERIGIAMPSFYVCSFEDSIFNIDHCEDNYLPGFLKFFDIDDIACLIAPRPLVIVAGKNDPIFPLDGVEKAFRKIEKIYSKAGVPDNCKMVVGDDGHRFYEHLAWPVWKKLSGW